MNDLIQTLTSSLGVDTAQAEGGVGLIAKMAQDKLGGDFSQISDKFPEIMGMIGKAPAAEGATAGIGGMVGSALSAMGAGNLGNLASLASGFKSLGLDAGMVTQFAPVVMSYFGDNGGDAIKGLMEKVLK